MPNTRCLPTGEICQVSVGTWTRDTRRPFACDARRAAGTQRATACCHPRSAPSTPLAYRKNMHVLSGRAWVLGLIAAIGVGCGPASSLGYLQPPAGTDQRSGLGELGTKVSQAL